MSEQASGNRSVVARDTQDTVVVTGDQNTVIQVTVIMESPQVSALLPGRVALAGLLDSDRLFHHGHVLVGRDGELNGLVAAVRDPDRRVVALAARGGAGKTRLLLALDDCLTAEGLTVRWVAQEARLDAVALTEIPDGPAVVIVDDAHRRNDLGGLLRRLAARPDVTLVVAARPHGLRRIEIAVTQAGHDDASWLTKQGLERLDREAARALATEAVGRQSDDVLALADATVGFPLLTVVGGHLLARDRLRPGQLAAHEAYRNQILDRWTEESVGALHGEFEPAVVRRALATLAALAPYREDGDLAAEVAGFLQISPEEFTRLTGELEAVGLLDRRGSLLRVVPDVFADELLRREAVTATDRPSGFVDALFDAFPSQATTVLRSVAEVNLRLRIQGSEVDLLGVVWQKLRDDLLGGGAVHRLEWLSALAEIGFYQPERMLALAGDVLDDPVEPEARGTLYRQDVTQHEVDHAAAARLREVAHHLEYLPEACELLWQLGRDDDCEPTPRGGHPLSVLSELVGYEPGKPLAYQQAVVDRVAAWLAANPSAGAAGVTPLGLLTPVTAKSGPTTSLSGWTVEMGSFFVSAAATLPLRRRVLDLAVAHLGADDLQVAIDASGVLERFLREPAAYFGNTLSNDDEMAEQWRDEQLAVLHHLRQAAENGNLHPVVALHAREAVAWHARRGQDAVREAARALWQLLTDRYNLDLLIELAGTPFGDDDDLDGDRRNYQAHMARAAARRDRLVDALLADYTPSALMDHLESLVGQLARSGKRSPNPNQLLWRMAERSPDRGGELADLLALAPDRPITVALQPLLAGLVSLASERAVTIAHSALDDPSLVKARAVAQAWAWAAWAWSDEPVRRVFDRVISHPDSGVRAIAIDRLRTLAHSDPAAATAALLDVCIDSLDVADEVAAVLVHELHDQGHPLSDPSAVDRLLNHLKPLTSLGQYWVEELLRQLTQQHLLAVTRFFLDRMAHASDHAGNGDFLEVVPFDWRVASEGQRVADLPGADEALRLVRDAALEPDWAYQRWTSHLFAALADGYDTLALEVLNEFVTTGMKAHVVAAATLLEQAPSTFVLDRVPFVADLVTAARTINSDCLTRVRGALWSSAIHGSYSRTAGKPSPRDIELHDGARSVAADLPPGPARTFYKQLAADAEQRMADDLRRDAELLA
jgi:hypothetical protein